VREGKRRRGAAVRMRWLYLEIGEVVIGGAGVSGRESGGAEMACVTRTW
jgi:hypothetical protein